jgi:hypothetical protein
MTKGVRALAAMLSEISRNRHQMIKGKSPGTLVDMYHAERHPVGARVLKTTMAQVALFREDDRTLAARDIVGELLKMEEPCKRIAGMMSGLDIRYEHWGRGHPLLARLSRYCSTSDRRGVLSPTHAKR